MLLTDSVATEGIGLKQSTKNIVFKGKCVLLEDVIDQWLLFRMNSSGVCEALETGVGTLLASAQASVESAVSAQHAAAKTVGAHTDLLRKAMDVSYTRQAQHRQMTESFVWSEQLSC